MSSAQALADQHACGLETIDTDKNVGGGSSGKGRSKNEQADHKKANPDAGTRKIVTNAQHGEDKRRDEQLKKDKK